MKNFIRLKLIEQKNKLLILFILIFISALFSNYPIKYIQKIVDSSLNDRNTTIMLNLGIKYLIMQIARAFLVAYMKYLSNYLQQDIGSSVQKRVFNHLMDADMILLDNKNSNSIINLIIEDSNYIINNTIMPITNIIFSIISFCFGLYFTISINPYLPLFIIPLGFATAFISKTIKKKSNDNANELRNRSESLWKSFEEGIKGIIPIRIFNYNKIYKVKVNSNIESMYDIVMKQARIDSLSYFALSTLFMLCIGVILIISSIFVSKGFITVGGLTAVLMYNSLLTDPLIDSLEIQQSIIKLKISIKRLDTIISIPKDKMVLKRKKHIDSFSMENVYFKFDDVNILNNINLNIPKSFKVAIVGDTGSGKSTLAKLIAGLYPCTSGEIKYYSSDNLVDANPIVSYLIQDGYLFDMNLIDNIRIFNSDITKQELEHIIEICGLSNINKLYSKKTIGENGKLLSGGEKKRIELARTLAFSDADLYIFDELTTSLDKTMADFIMKNVQKELSEKICIFIEHNLEFTKNMDSIIVMREGRIIETGNYDKLISDKSYFYKLLTHSF